MAGEPGDGRCGARAGARYCTTAWWRERLSSPRRFPPRLGDLAVTAANQQDGTVEVIFRADPNIYDGRYANVGWLQEIPKPITSMSWDNAALMSYRTLAKFGLAEQDVVAIESNGNTVMAPVMAVPGHADGSVTLYLGYARRNGGRVAGGLGFNAYAIRTSNASVVCFRRDHEEDGPDL